MESNRCTRRTFVIRLAALPSGLSIAGNAFGATDSPRAAGGEEISHACEAIHQEIVFKAGRERVYQALTSAEQFDKVTRLSAAMASAMVPRGTPTEISRDVGGTFSIFGGYISGRQVELLPNDRIVQVWRTATWKPGEYSVVNFEFTDHGSGTKLIFDHKAFPDGEAEHLAKGWHSNYWEPLAKYLA